MENLYAHSQRARHDDSRKIVMRIAVPRAMIRDDSLILVGRDSQGSMIRTTRDVEHERRGSCVLSSDSRPAGAK